MLRRCDACWRSASDAPHDVCTRRASAQNAAYAPAPLDAAAAAEVRREQAARLCAWMDGALAGGGPGGAGSVSAVVVAGDLNAPPGEPAQRLLADWGLLAAHGADLEGHSAPTWPTPLQAPLKEWGAPSALDFILVRRLPARCSAVRVLAAHRVGAPAGGRGHDVGLYPSEHYGVVAHLEFARAGQALHAA
jgi:hypothetical protein